MAEKVSLRIKQLMSLVAREDADYAVEISVDFDMAETVLRQACRFVRRMLEYLARKGFLGESTE